MMKRLVFGVFACFLFALAGQSQPVPGFDANSEGPWSDLENTTLMVPKVANGSVTADGSVSSAEYGGFEGQEVIPGETGWVLGFQQDDSAWEGPEDSSFTFYLAYDDDFLYVGVEALDDVVRTNDPPESFWKDDAIEIVMDPTNYRFDYNSDAINNRFGGHVYFNYEGIFSDWTEDGTRRNRGSEDEPSYRWTGDVEWTHGEDGDIYGFGQETDTGWTLEVRFSKRTLDVPEGAIEILPGVGGPGNSMEPGNTMAFNIGVDDDDGSDLNAQYFWANRLRAINANPDDENWALLLEDEILNKEFLNPDSLAALWDIGIDDNGRLSYAGAGEITFMEPTSIADWSLFE